MKVNEHAVLEAALPVFKARGIRSVQLREIAFSSGIKLQELKSQFQTKKTFISAFVDYLLGRHKGYLQINPLLSATAITELQNFFHFVEKLASELTPTMLLELKKYNATGWDKLIEFKDHRLVPYLQQNFERGVREGYYRGDINTDQYVTMYFSLLYGIATEFNLSFGESQKMLLVFHKVFMRGILSARGIRM